MARLRQRNDQPKAPSNSRSKIVVLKLGDALKMVPSNGRSKVVALKVGDALEGVGRDHPLSSAFEATASNIVTLRVPKDQLAKISHHNERFQVPSTLPSSSNTEAGEELARPPDSRLHRSVVAISEAGSPMRSRGALSVQEADQEHLTAVSNQNLNNSSDSPNLPADMEARPSNPISLEEHSPPFRYQMSTSAFHQQMRSPTLNQQIDLSPIDWQKRQSQFQRQLGLPGFDQRRGNSPQIDRLGRHATAGWPTLTPLNDLDDLDDPLGSLYAPLPFNSSPQYVPVPNYNLAFPNQRILPVTMSSAFAAEGWNQNLNAAASNLTASAYETIDPDDYETTDLDDYETTDLDDYETSEEFKERLMFSIEQMMFVSGETAEASPETTGMIEEIVRAQVIEMLRKASDLANRRGVRSISTADLIFLIRHDKAKVSRLKTFLSWKDVRKNVKDSDEKGGGDAGEVDFDDGANLPGAGPVDAKKSSNKKAKLILPWEVQSFYSEQVPEREDEEDNEEEEEQNEATLARLASADERTKNMTRDEYVYWSDCRQASFTFRKGKRFREWAGFGVVTDSKPNDDIVDILGFLTFEIVQTLTEEALKVKGAEDLHNARTSSAAGGEAKKRKREGSSLFEMPEEGRTPVEPKHVREAFRRLQIVPKKFNFMRPGYAGAKTPLRLI